MTRDMKANSGAFVDFNLLFIAGDLPITKYIIDTNTSIIYYYILLYNMCYIIIYYIYSKHKMVHTLRSVLPLKYR